ncbi:hypothetical protein K457DRAFT_1879242 [Linnemannia elongata AG-77]|uniref:Uncharacterized protein n=1 Tax=Linnemannia elongata AG-77 TaxID=1314771 RepID=A0A197JN35_9FUNG|nr:hypothetical protein K457DRAFT_1879242 [Linnemannia elongata AG-77]
MEFVTNCENQSVRVWRILLDGANVVVKMLWGFNVGALCAEGLASKDAVYLSPVNQKLLVQRGAVDSSLVHEGEGKFDQTMPFSDHMLLLYWCLAMCHHRIRWNLVLPGLENAIVGCQVVLGEV